MIEKKGFVRFKVLLIIVLVIVFALLFMA